MKAMLWWTAVAASISPALGSFAIFDAYTLEQFLQIQPVSQDCASALFVALSHTYQFWLADLLVSLEIRPSLVMS